MSSTTTNVGAQGNMDEQLEDRRVRLLDRLEQLFGYCMTAASVLVFSCMSYQFSWVIAETGILSSVMNLMSLYAIDHTIRRIILLFAKWAFQIIAFIISTTPLGVFMPSTAQIFPHQRLFATPPLPPISLPTQESISTVCDLNIESCMAKVIFSCPHLRALYLWHNTSISVSWILPIVCLCWGWYIARNIRQEHPERGVNNPSTMTVTFVLAAVCLAVVAGAGAPVQYLVTAGFRCLQLAALFKVVKFV